MSALAIPALLAKDDKGEILLKAPKVGLWSDHPRHGAFVEPGSSIGTLYQLGRRYVLLVPHGVTGRVATTGRPQDALPVAYGDTLVRIAAPVGLSAEAAPGPAEGSRQATGSLAILAPTDGVFYRSPAVGAKPFVAVGDRVTNGRAVGLIEVMKTFNPIAYGGEGFPDEAEVVDVVAGDAQEVRAGQTLVVVKRL
jgi:acetyl-CoA carboxylase biotin carboxyl carrier protein